MFKIINFLPPRTPSSLLYRQNSVLKIIDLFRQQCLLFIYKYQHNLLPAAFLSHFTTVRQIHQHFTRISVLNYHFDRPKTNYLKRCPSYIAAHLYSEIPSTIKNSKISKFKRYVFEYFHKNY